MKDLDPNESGLAIFKNGLLMFVTNTTDEEQAHREYAEDVGFDRSEHPISGVSFYEISAGEMPAWEDADATTYPVVDSSDLYSA